MHSIMYYYMFKFQKIANKSKKILTKYELIPIINYQRHKSVQNNRKSQKTLFASRHKKPVFNPQTGPFKRKRKPHEVAGFI